jgi:hypothetical protein
LSLLSSRRSCGVYSWPQHPCWQQALIVQDEQQGVPHEVLQTLPGLALQNGQAKVTGLIGMYSGSLDTGRLSSGSEDYHFRF